MKSSDYKEFANHQEFYNFDLNIAGEKVPVFIALHRIRNGIAIGGTRMLQYASVDEAIKDALNLSRGMTYKCLLAGIPYGGGKGVIFADPNSNNADAMLTAYAEKVNELAGRFYTGEDVGLSPEAVERLGQYSKYIIGRPSKTGIPAPYAAKGVFTAMKTALKYTMGSDGFQDKTVAIKGLGAVGSELARLLSKHGIQKIYGADVLLERAQALEKEIPALELVTTESIHTTEVDIYAPCALGYDLTPERVETLGAKIVCGAANNQLADDSVAEQLFQRNVIYIPDYVANAGGLIHVADELQDGGYSEERVEQKIKEIGAVVEKILDASSNKCLNHSIVSTQLATELDT